MNCDHCAKLLTEDDTHESILCTKCMQNNGKLRCGKCKREIKIHDFLTRIIKKVNGDKIIFGILFLMPIILVCISPFKPDVAFRMAIGYTTIPVIILVLWILFPCVYRLGRWFSKRFDFCADFHIDDGPEGILIWFLGWLDHYFSFQDVMPGLFLRY